jgi:hypothetical protein
VGPRSHLDSSAGVLAIYAGDHLPTGASISALNMYASNTGLITPLLLEQTDARQWTLRGVGASRTITSTGAQSIPFDLQAGSNVAANGNYTFGFITASADGNGNILNTTTGVVPSDLSVDAGAGVSGGASSNDWAFTGGPAPLGIGSLWGDGGTFILPPSVDRTYSATASTTTFSVSEPPITVTDQSLSAVNEGDVGATVTVATFTHANGIEPSNAFTATVSDGVNNWSDAAITGPDGNGVYTVQANRPSYAEDGTETITVTVSENGGESNSGSNTTSLVVSEPTINASPVTLAAINEGTGAGAVTVATFTHGTVPESSISATIDWGVAGHTADAGTVVSDGNGNYHVTGVSPTYAEEGGYTIGVSISDDTVNAMTSSSLTVNDAPLSAVGVNVQVAEGANFSGAVATFTDANLGDNTGEMSATIDWGDSHSSPGNISYDPGTKTYSVAGTNTYTEDGAYTISVSIQDAGGAVANTQHVSTTPSSTYPGLFDNYGVAVDASNNVYVAESIPSRVAVFSQGNPSPTNFLSGIPNPTWVAVDPAGNVCVASAFTSTAGFFEPGHTTPSYLLSSISNPQALAVDASGNLYVSNAGNNTVTEYAAGSGTPTATFTGLSNPASLALDQFGDLFVRNGNSTVSVFASGSLTPTATLTGFINPQGLAVDTAGDLFVADYGANTVIEFAAGTFTPAATLTGLNGSGSLGFDGHGNLFVVNSGTNTVSEFAGNALVATLSGLSQPIGFAIDGEGNVYVSNYAGGFVTEYGVLTTPGVQSTATVSEPSINASGAALGSIDEGTNLGTATVATFTHGTVPESGITATIDWGVDGYHADAGTVVSDGGGNYHITGVSPTYAEEGNYTIAVTINDDTVSAGTSTTLAVADAPLTGVYTATATGGVENVTPATLANADYTDANSDAPASDFTVAAVTWGDGSTDTTGLTVTGSGSNYTVVGSHLYLEEGHYDFTITVKDDGGSTTVITGSTDVADPTILVQGVASFSLAEGSATLTNALVATFTDPGNPALGNNEDGSDYSATIAWGDGASGAGTIVNNNDGTFSVYGTHTYSGDNLVGAGGKSEGATTMSVTITHDATTAQTVSNTVNISDPNVIATGGNTFNLTEGSATLTNVLVAEFSDPGNPAPGNNEDASDYAATIAWGDGASGAGTIVNNNDGTFSVYGTHTYSGDNIITAGNESEGAAISTVTIRHDATTPQVVNDTANIADAPLSASGLNITGTEGISTGTVTLAKFTDLGGAEEPGDSSATIIWGGTGVGSTTGVIVANGDGSFSVKGSYTYTEEGTYSVAVHIVHDASVTADTTSMAKVADAALTASPGPNFNPSEGTPFSNQLVGTVTDATPLGSASDFTATINWGDGNFSTGTVVLVSHGAASSSYHVLGGHTYAMHGAFHVSVDIVDVGGSTADTDPLATTGTVQSSILVLNSSASGSLAVSGQAQLSVTGTIQVDSNSSTALQDSGQAKITAGNINVVGSSQISGQATASPAPVLHASYVADPLMSLLAPNPTTYGLTNKGALNLSGGTQTIYPGIYTSIAVSGNGTVLKLQPGIYAMAGNFTVSGQTTVQGLGGVMIYLAGSNFVNNGAAGGTFAAISVSGQSSLNITPMNGGPYAGLAVFQSGYASQSGVDTQPLNFSGASVLPGGGMVYAAAGQLNLSGQTAFKASVIAGTMKVSGNSIAQTVAPDNTSSAFTPAQVRSAYGINSLPLDGSGQTIAIVDAYDDPSIIQSVDAFDSQFSAASIGASLYQQYGPAGAFLPFSTRTDNPPPCPVLIRRAAGRRRLPSISSGPMRPHRVRRSSSSRPAASRWAT